VYLLDQKVPVRVPRVRDRRLGVEIPLESYRRLQQPQAVEEGMLRRVLYGLSCRDYRAAAEPIPEAFGLSRSSVSRWYVRATARQLEALLERRLDRYDFVALVLDGKTFADDTMVIALGVTLGGEKVVLGFVQTGTENAAACTTFLRGLVERGLRVEEGLLVVVESFRQEVWNFASGGDLLGSLDPVHVPDARVDLREQVRGVQAAETPFRHQEHLPDHGGGPV
jgi:putative transposase